MSEINCFIDINNSTMNFMITMDADVNWKMFNEEVSKYVASINPSNLKFSYIDEAGDKISFGSDVELKEAFEYALSLGEGNVFVIFVETVNNISPSPVESIPSNNEVKEEPKKPSNPLFNILQGVLKDQKPNQWEQLFSTVINELPSNSENIFEEVNNVIHKVFNDEKLQNDIQNIANKFVPGLEVNFLRPQSPVCNNNNNNVNSRANTQIHFAFCDHCKKRIEGIRYKCLQCPDYDFCEVCEELNQKEKLHDENHFFAKLYKPLPAPFRNIFNQIQQQQQQQQQQYHPRPPRCHRPFHHMFHQMNNAAGSNNNNNNVNNEEKKAARCPIFVNHCQEKKEFKGPVVRLEEKVSQLEKQLEEIKSLVAAKNNQAQNQVDLSSPIQSSLLPEPISPQPIAIPSESVNAPVNESINNNNNDVECNNDNQAVSLSPQEEECHRILREMGFDIHSSIISENNADLALIIEKLM